MAGNDAAQKFFDALNEGADAIIDAIRAANDRGHRVSTALIEQAQEGQREAVELARKWAASPFDIPGLYSSLVETSTKAQGRTLDATRQWFNEMSDAQKETRELVQRMIKANRTAGEATVDFARSMFTRASEAVQSMGDGNGRTAIKREPSRTAEAAASEPQPSIEP